MEQDIKALSKEESEIYIRFLVAVCKSDGPDIDEREKNYVNLQAELIRLENPDEYWEEDIRTEDLDCSVLSEKSRLAIIRDCIVIANIDNEYHELERKEIFKIAETIDMPAEKVEEIESWLEEYWAVLRRGVQLFNPN